MILLNILYNLMDNPINKPNDKKYKELKFTATNKRLRTVPIKK